MPSPSESSVTSTSSIVSRQSTPVDMDGLSYPSKVLRCLLLHKVKDTDLCFIKVLVLEKEEMNHPKNELNVKKSWLKLSKRSYHALVKTQNVKVYSRLPIAMPRHLCFSQRDMRRTFEVRCHGDGGGHGDGSSLRKVSHR